MSEDNTARLWYAAANFALGENLSFKATWRPMKHEGGVSLAGFSPDGQRVLIASEDATAQLWDAASGEALGDSMRCGGRISSAQFSPDGLRVLTTSEDGIAQFWDTATGKALAEPMKHGAIVNWAAFSPDGRRMVTASTDGSLRFWELSTSKAIGHPTKHETWFYSALGSRDKQRVTAASGDKTSCLWNVPPISEQETNEDMLLLADLAEATSGFALQISDQADILRPLSGDQINATRWIIAGRLASPKRLTPLQRFLKWSVSDPRNRTVSPVSELTVPEWVENMIEEGTVDSLQAAMHVDPSNARLAAHYGRRLTDYAVAKGTDPYKGGSARVKADYQTRRALKLAPDNDDVRKLRVEVAELLQLPVE